MTPTDGESDNASATAEHGRRDAGFDEEALYVVVRSAVEDAILGVLGTIMLLGIALVVVWVGGALAVSGESTGTSIVGFLAIVFGFYVAASSLEIIPPARTGSDLARRTPPPSHRVSRQIPPPSHGISRGISSRSH